MNQSRRLKRLAWFLLGELCAGKSAEFVINQRKQMFGGAGIPPFNLVQDLGNGLRLVQATKTPRCGLGN